MLRALEHSALKNRRQAVGRRLRSSFLSAFSSGLKLGLSIYGNNSIIPANDP